MLIYLAPTGIYHICKTHLKQGVAYKYELQKDGYYKCVFCDIKFPSLLASPYTYFHGIITIPQFGRTKVNIRHLEQYRIEV